MFGMTEALLSFIRRQVGVRTDAADAAGSLHAKLADIRNQVMTRQAPRSVVTGRFYTQSKTFVTALNITGKGRLVRVRLEDGTGDVKVTIDGNVIVQSGTQVDGTQLSPFGFDNEQFDCNFKSSLKIELRVNEGDANFGAVQWVYELE